MAMKYMKEDNEPAEIIPGLFLGSVGIALLKNKLHEKEIKTIMCVAN